MGRRGLGGGRRGGGHKGGHGGRKGGRGGRGGRGPVGGAFGRMAGQSFRTPKGHGRGGHGATPGGGKPNRHGPGGRPRRHGNQRANARPNNTKSTTNDPIDVVTGEVLLTQTDVTLPGVLPLVLERTHVSSLRAGRLFGASWASTLDQHLELDPAGVHFVSADATVLNYPQALLPNIQFQPADGPQWPLLLTSDGGYRITDPRGGRTLHFPAPGEEHGWSVLPLVAITDRNGNRVDLVYEDRFLVEIRHSAGYRIAVESAPLESAPLESAPPDSSAERRITALRLLPGAADGQPSDDLVMARFGYDSDGHLTELVNSSGRPLRFSYDDEGRLTGWVDRNDFWYRYEYDDEGRAVRGIGKDGALSTALVFDPDNRTTKVTDALGMTTVYTYNDQFQVVEETDPLGATHRFEWDSHDRLLARTDPLGAVSRYGYDEHGNLTSITYPDGSRTTIVHDEMHLPVQITEADGAVWRQTYDAAGNLTAMTDPAGSVTRLAYAEGGRPLSVTDPLGHTTRIEANAAGQPLTVTDPAGAVTRYAYDAAGRLTNVVDAVGGVTRFGWTPEGDPLWRVHPDGATERWAYDAEGNLTGYTDALGGTSRVEVGAFDQPSAQVDPDGARLVFERDAELRLISVTNPQGLAWRYDYDAAGRVVRERDFNGRTVTYAYDAAGRLSARTNGAGQTTEFVRNELGDIVERRSGDQVAHFGYDAAGRMVRAVNGDADVRIERDVLGRPVTESCNGMALHSAYDAVGNRVRRRTPSGAESVWTYDALQQPLGLAVAGQRLTFEYDAAGRETKRRLGANAILVQQWDAAGRLSGQTVWGAPVQQAGAPVQQSGAPGRPRLLQHRSYAYRPDGVVSGVGDRLTGDRRFDLDRAGRVTGVHGQGWSERYAYDAAGNVTQATWPAPTGGRGAGVVGERAYAGTLVQNAGGARFEHDAQGRVVTRQDAPSANWRYSWDAEDRLTGIETPDGSRWRYRYDALGRRIGKQRLTPDGRGVLEQTDFIWDGPTLAEQVHRTWVPERNSYVGSGKVWEYGPDGIRPLTQTERGPADGGQEWVDRRFYAIVTDLVGTPNELVDPAGGIAWRPRRPIWGGRPDGAGDERAAPFDCPLDLPGQYLDAESGLSYNVQRYYDPGLGRYASPDPLGLAPQPNPHAYVPNPLTGLDPLGLAPYLSGDNPFARRNNRAIGEEYEKIKAMRAAERNGIPSPLGRPTPRVHDRDTVVNGVQYRAGDQKIFQGNQLEPRQRAIWQGAREWDVPGTPHRILELPDGRLGYAYEHHYGRPQFFPGPWYPEGGKIPRFLERGRH